MRTHLASLLFIVLLVNVISAQKSDNPPPNEVRQLIRKLELAIDQGDAGSLLPGGGFQATNETMKSLRKLGPEAAPAVPVLMRAMREGDGALPSSASLTISGIGKPAVPSLVEALSSQDAGLRVQSLYALRRIGKDARPAVPKLLKLLYAQDQLTRGAAAEALGRIAAADNERVVAELISALENENDAVRHSAVNSLGHLGAGSEKIAKVLVAVVKNGDESHHVRSEAAKALARVGPVSDQVIPGLVSLLQSEAPELQSASAHALYLLGSEAKPASAALSKFVANRASPPPDLRGEEAYAWELLHRVARINAAMALGQLRDSDAEIEKVLRAVAKDDTDTEVREAAGMALKTE